MLMAVVLSFLAVTSWSAITGGCQPPKRKPVPADDAGQPPADAGDPTDGGATDAGAGDAGTEDTAGTDGADPSGSNGPRRPVPRPDTPAGPHAHDDVEATEATLTSDELEVGFTSQGGGVTFVRLRNVFEDDGKTPMDLVVPADPLMLFGQSDTTHLRPTAAPGGVDRKNEPAGPMRRLHWKLEEQSSDAVAYSFTDGGVTWQKTWTLASGKDRFGLRLDLRAWRSPEAAEETDPTATASLKLLASSGQLREVFRGVFGNPNTALVFRTGDSEVDESGTFGVAPVEMPVRGAQRLRLFGTRSTYFLVTYYADVANDVSAPVSLLWATGEQGDQRGVMEDRLQSWYAAERDLAADASGALKDKDMAGRIHEGVKQMLHAWMVLDVPVAARKQDAEPTRLDFFAGPMDRAVLGADTYRPLTPVLTYPSAPDFVAKVLLWIYDLWRGLTGSAGVAVILMTLCVRGGLMPLSIRNQLSMRAYGRKVAKIKPKLTAIQEKYAKNPKRLREEQMKLYRENGVGFPSGCVMMLVQIPIFFALFSALRVEYSIRGESFLWIKDLAGPDRLIDFGKPLLGIDLGMFRLDALNILPIAMVALSIWHTRSMPKPADEQQAQQMKMMKWLPIFFAFILYNYTAALALYMVFSSAIALVEAKIVRAKDDADAAADAEPTAQPA